MRVAAATDERCVEYTSESDGVGEASGSPGESGGQERARGRRSAGGGRSWAAGARGQSGGASVIVRADARERVTSGQTMERTGQGRPHSDYIAP